MQKKLTRRVLAYTMRTFDLAGQPIRDQRRPWSTIRSWPYVPPDPPDGRPSRIHVMGTEARSIVIRGMTAAGRANGVFGSTRYDDLPMRKNLKEQLRDLPLDPDEGLELPSHWHWVDFSHCPPVTRETRSERVSVLLMERMRPGPTSTQLQDYLNEKLHDHNMMVAITPLVVDDAWERMRAAGEVTRVSVRVGRPDDESSGDFASGIRGLWSATPEHTKRLDLAFTPAKGKRYDADDIEARLRAMAEMDEIEQLRVEVREGAVIDLLEDRLGYKVEVERQRSNTRVASTSSILTELQRVFTSQRDHFARILGRSWAEPPDAPTAE